MIRILFAFSDKKILDMISNYLVIHGFDVDVTETSDDVISFLTGDRAYDIFVCGAHLKPMKGIDLCKRIRKHDDPLIRSTKILFAGQEKPDIEMSRQFVKYDMYNIVLYRRLSIWLEKIEIIMAYDKDAVKQ